MIEGWKLYCADKRTDGGWAFFGPDSTGSWHVWQPFPEDGDQKDRRHDSAAAACADYILAELDYWSAVGSG